mgnify:CR=1 FL=1
MSAATPPSATSADPVSRITFAVALPPEPVFGVPGVPSVDVVAEVEVCAKAGPASRSAASAPVVMIFFAVIGSFVLRIKGRSTE